MKSELVPPSEVLDEFWRVLGANSKAIAVALASALYLAAFVLWNLSAILLHGAKWLRDYLEAWQLTKAPATFELGEKRQGETT